MTPASRPIIRIYNMTTSDYGQPSVLCKRHVQEVKDALRRSGWNATHTGLCIDGYKRHKWGKEQGYNPSPFRSFVYKPCTRCNRRQFIVYDRHGNHVEGYRTVENA